MSKLSRFIDFAKRALDEGLDRSDNRDHRGQTRPRPGNENAHRFPAAPPTPSAAPSTGPSVRSTARHGAPTERDRRAPDQDRQAVARYAYLLRTASPEQLERVHREAFSSLPPAQREELRRTLGEGDPTYGSTPSADPAHLAVAATRVESARPGSLQRLLGASGRRGGSGWGKKAALGGASVAAGGLLLAVAGGAVLTSAGGALLAGAESLGVDFGALADGLDPAAFGLDSLTDLGLDGVAEGVSGASEALGGLGDQLGQALSDVKLPGIGDLFGR